MWASDTELIYTDAESQSLVSATLQLGETVQVLERRPLFSLADYLTSIRSPLYDISRDGQRILAVRRVQGAELSPEPRVVLNWFTEIERRLAEQGGG